MSLYMDGESDNDFKVSKEMYNKIEQEYTRLVDVTMKQSTRIVTLEKFLLHKEKDWIPAPCCGSDPNLPSGEGTQYEVECDCGHFCVRVQISDTMTIEERTEEPFTDFKYSLEYVARAAAEAKTLWNTRWKEER